MVFFMLSRSGFARKGLIAVLAVLLVGASLLLAYVRWADGTISGAAGSTAGLLAGPVRTLLNGEKASPESSGEAARLGSDHGSIAYSDLGPALKEAERLSLGVDGSAVLFFADGSQASSSFPPDDLTSLARASRDAGKEVVVADSFDSDPLISGALFWSVIRVVLGAILVLALITLIFNAAERRNNKRRSGRASAPATVKKKATDPVDEQPVTTFGDVAGCDEAIEEIHEFVEFIRDPERFRRVGAMIPSGAVLYGPPGTGKTLLARALAGEAEVPFFYISGAEAVHKYVGVGAETIRNLFRRARASEEGAVVFIDEIDAIGRTRSGSDEQASREYDQTLNQLLVELDGFNGRENVVVIGATNRLDVLDPALLRPGRLSRHIPVLPPSEEGRRAILALYTRGKPLAADVDLDSLARITAGSSGADLADMVNEAAIQAARNGTEEISEADMREGHLRALAGPKRLSSGMRPEEEQQIACHEAGHVLCAELSPDHEKAQRVTIISRGQAAGMAVYGREDRALHSPEYVRQQLVSVLGGRAAERVVFGTVSSGAANDLQHANELARRAIEEWGLSQLTGQLVSRGAVSVSDRTRSLVDQEVEGMVADAFADAVSLLEEHRSELDSLTASLLEQKSLERVDILAAIGSKVKAKTRPLHPGPQLRPVIGKGETHEHVPRPKANRPLAALRVVRMVRARFRRRQSIPTTDR